MLFFFVSFDLLFAYRWVLFLSSSWTIFLFFYLYSFFVFCFCSHFIIILLLLRDKNIKRHIMELVFLLLARAADKIRLTKRRQRQQRRLKTALYIIYKEIYLCIHNPSIFHWKSSATPREWRSVLDVSGCHQMGRIIIIITIIIMIVRVKERVKRFELHIRSNWTFRIIFRLGFYCWMILRIEIRLFLNFSSFILLFVYFQLWIALLIGRTLKFASIEINFCCYSLLFRGKCILKISGLFH